MNCNPKEKHIGLLFKCIDKKIVSEFNKELEKFDITLMQHEVLRYILCHEYKEDVFQKQIEEFFSSTNPTITGILKRLECKELIRREVSSVDARYKKLTLTEKGREVMEQASLVGPKNIEHMLTHKLTGEERNELERLLVLVLEGMGS